MEYKHIAVPKPLFDKFEAIRPALSYRTFTEFVVESLRSALDSASWKAEKVLDKMVEEKMEEEI